MSGLDIFCVGLMGLFPVFATLCGELKKDGSHLASRRALIIFAIAFLAFSYFSIGNGHALSRLGRDGRSGIFQSKSLEENQIYETLSSVSVGGGEWAVVLKDQDGDVFAYFLKEDPPKVFKRGGSNEEHVYTSYPPAPETGTKIEVPDPRPEGK